MKEERRIILFSCYWDDELWNFYRSCFSNPPRRILAIISRYYFKPQGQEKSHVSSYPTIGFIRQPEKNVEITEEWRKSEPKRWKFETLLIFGKSPEISMLQVHLELSALRNVFIRIWPSG